jgi:hypothetical protein
LPLYVGLFGLAADASASTVTSRLRSCGFLLTLALGLFQQPSHPRRSG